MLANFAKDVFANDIIYDGGVLVYTVQFNCAINCIYNEMCILCIFVNA